MPQPVVLNTAIKPLPVVAPSQTWDGESHPVPPFEVSSGLCQFGIASAIGPRQRLEDSGFAIGLLGHGALGTPECVLLGLFDGVGGASSGDDASRIGARVCAPHLCAAVCERLGGSIQPGQACEAIRSAIRKASEAVRLHASLGPGREGAATTAVIAMKYEGWAAFGWVGDSRAYLARRGDIERLSTDHTAAERLYEQGRIDAADLPDHPEAHTLTQWVGGEGPPEVSLGTRSLSQNDTLVLLTDGVHGVLTDSMIAAIVANAVSAQEAADRLVSAALLHGTNDNATAACCRVAPAEEVAHADAPIPTTQPSQETRDGSPRNR